jgi:hypothetical protein
MLQTGPIYAEIRKVNYPMTPTNHSYSTIEDQSLESLISALKDPEMEKTDKANALLVSNLPFDIKVRAILEATTRPGVEPPKNIEEFHPEFHLDPTNSVPELVTLMAAYVEVALIRSPFYDGHRLHDGNPLSELNSGSSAYCDTLQDIWTARNQINQKLEDANFPSIFSTFKACGFLTFGEGVGKPKEPAWDFNYCKFTDVDFYNLNLSSTNNFKNSSFDSCFTYGKDSIFNVDTLIANSALVRNFKVMRNYIKDGIAQITAPKKPFIIEKIDNRKVSKVSLQKTTLNPNVLRYDLPRSNKLNNSISNLKNSLIGHEEKSIKMLNGDVLRRAAIDGEDNTIQHNGAVDSNLASVSSTSKTAFYYYTIGSRSSTQHNTASESSIKPDEIKLAPQATRFKRSKPLSVVLLSRKEQIIISLAKLKNKIFDSIGFIKISGLKHKTSNS